MRPIARKAHPVAQMQTTLNGGHNMPRKVAIAPLSLKAESRDCGKQRDSRLLSNAVAGRVAQPRHSSVMTSGALQEDPPGIAPFQIFGEIA
jgi:hypothetical protein